MLKLLLSSPVGSGGNPKHREEPLHGSHRCCWYHRLGRVAHAGLRKGRHAHPGRLCPGLASTVYRAKTVLEFGKR